MMDPSAVNVSAPLLSLAGFAAATTRGSRRLYVVRVDQRLRRDYAASASVCLALEFLEPLLVFGLRHHFTSQLPSEQLPLPVPCSPLPAFAAASAFAAATCAFSSALALTSRSTSAALAASCVSGTAATAGLTVERVKAVVKREMEGALDLGVPLDVSVGVGDNWLEAH